MIIAYYSQRRVEIYKLGFFIQRAKSQLCVQGKYTTVASYTELPPWDQERRSKAVFQTCTRHDVEGEKEHMESWCCTSRPRKWPHSYSSCLGHHRPLRHLSPSSSVPPRTPRGPVPSLAWSPLQAPSGILAHCHTAPGHCLTSYYLDVEEPLFIPSLRLCYVLFKCVC